MHESKTGGKVDKQSERKEKAGKKKVKQDSKTGTSNRSTEINTDNDNNSRVIKSKALFPFPVHYCHTHVA